MLLRASSNYLYHVLSDQSIIGINTKWTRIFRGLHAQSQKELSPRKRNWFRLFLMFGIASSTIHQMKTHNFRSKKSSIIIIISSMYSKIAINFYNVKLTVLWKPFGTWKSILWLGAGRSTIVPKPQKRVGGRIVRAPSSYKGISF